MGRYRRCAVAFGGMVPAGQEGDAHLACIVGLGFGDFTGDERIGPGGNGGLEVALGTAGAPRDVLDGFVGGIDQRHGPLEDLFRVGSKLLGIGKALAVFARAQKAEFLFAKAPGGAGMRKQAELQAELGVVAKLGVGIERQVVREQIDVVAKQKAQALLHPAGHAGVLAAPEQAVVNEDGVGLGMNCGFYQRAAGRDARDDFPHHGAALDLQAVRSVVLEAGRRKKKVEGMQQFVAGGAHRDIVALPLPFRMAWPRAARGHRASTKPRAASTAT